MFLNQSTENKNIVKLRDIGNNLRISTIIAKIEDTN